MVSGECGLKSSANANNLHQCVCACMFANIRMLYGFSIEQICGRIYDFMYVVVKLLRVPY